MQLSKSEYMMFLRHPAWLWLKKHDKKKLPAPDDNLQVIFDSGVEFEKYATQRFPNGVDIGFSDYREYRSMPQRTQAAIDQGAKIIFQGRMEAVAEGNDITCIFDVIDKVGENTFDLYEVKSSTRAKPEHYPDLAFQTIVLESAGFKVRNIAVVHVNNQYVRNGKIDPLKLSEVTDVTESVRDKIEETKHNISLAFKVINSTKMPDPSPRYARLGSLNEWMKIYKLLGNEVDTYSIYNLTSPGAGRIGELEDLGITLIKDIPEDFKLSAKQQVQVMATQKDERAIDKEKIASFLKELVYPLYFLDYETAMGAIPLYDNTKPYQQIPFQYSLHVIKEAGKEIEHFEYLHRESDNPIPYLLNKMKQDIGPSGSVLVWYKNFEMRRNEEMGEMFPAFAKFLANVNERVVDLIDPFNNSWFVDKDFFGSSSIKNVLPVLVPELSYKELGVQEGASAQRLWMDAVIREKAGIDKEKLFFDLVEYCKMDTFAMVKIWEVLENL